MTQKRNPRDEKLVGALCRWFRRQPKSPTGVAKRMGVSPNTVLRLLPPELGGKDEEWKEIQESTRDALMKLLREEGALPPEMVPASGNSNERDSA